jgi:hypothetical protein
MSVTHHTIWMECEHSAKGRRQFCYKCYQREKDRFYGFGFEAGAAKGDVERKQQNDRVVRLALQAMDENATIYRDLKEIFRQLLKREPWRARISQWWSNRRKSRDPFPLP